jgi:predicted ATPase
MAELVIENFSCIDEAKIEFAPITILIGPQASGKSVISKLAYFFYDVPVKQVRAIEDGVEFEEFKSLLSEDFKKWFPPSAWG